MEVVWTPRSAGNRDYDYLLKLMVLGDPGVGKTSFLKKFGEGVFNLQNESNFDDKSGENRLIYREKGLDHLIQLKWWDGDENFRQLTCNLSTNSIGVLLLFDIADCKSFEDLTKWIDRLYMFSFEEESMMILCGNKNDLNHKRAVTDSTVKELANRYNLTYHETSGLTGYNVHYVIETLMSRLMHRVNIIANRARFQHNLISTRRAATNRRFLPWNQNTNSNDYYSFIPRIIIDSPIEEVDEPDDTNHCANWCFK